MAGGGPERTRAVENAGGLGYLLAQQLLAAGERVLGLPPKLATGHINRNDPNDARSAAVAALRCWAVKPVGLEDHQAVMTLWAKCHRAAPHPAGVPAPRRALRAGARRRNLPRGSAPRRPNRALRVGAWGLTWLHPASGGRVTR